MAGKGGNRHNSAHSQPQWCHLSSVAWLPTPGSRAGAAASLRAGAGLALRSSITCSLKNKFSSQLDSTVDFFLAPPVRHIRTQSTTFRLFLHDIPWKCALLPLFGMPTWPTSCLELAHKHGPTEGCRKEWQGVSCSSSLAGA